MDASDLLSKRANLTPSRIGMTDTHTGLHYTYAELNAHANRAANFLRHGLGLQKGDRVAILAHNSLAYIELFFAVGKIGVILCPLNWRLTPRELDYILGDLEPQVLVIGPEFTSLVPELKNRLQNVKLVSIEGASVEETGIDGAFCYEDETAQALPTEPARPPLDEEDPYCLMYTSGTTGHPKGAVIPHRQILWNAINTVVSWGLTEHDVAPIFTPLFHAGGLFVFLTPLTYVGGRMVLTRAFDPSESLSVVMSEKCTVILGVPTLFQMWYNSSAFKTADFSHIHFFISGGAPCPVSLMNDWRREKGVIFRQGYGLTEVGVNCFTMADEESVQKSGSVGKPVFHSKMRLVDQVTNMDVVPGESGELWIQGPHVCAGYWRNPTATAAAITDGWFHTGDMAHQDEDGFYYIDGRYKDMIKSGGENIYAAEVESVFREHWAVADAALIGIPDEKWGEVGLMIVLLKPGAQATEKELKDHCLGRLAKFKIPKEITFADKLPYSPYGKVEKIKLKQWMNEREG